MSLVVEDYSLSAPVFVATACPNESSGRQSNSLSLPAVEMNYRRRWPEYRARERRRLATSATVSVLAHLGAWAGVLLWLAFSPYVRCATVTVESGRASVDLRLTMSTVAPATETDLDDTEVVLDFKMTSADRPLSKPVKTSLPLPIKAEVVVEPVVELAGKLEPPKDDVQPPKWSFSAALMMSASAAATPPSPDSRKETGAELDRPPRKIFNPAPVYPLEARENGQTGRVVLRVQISAGGEVLRASLYRTSGVPSLDQAALEAVRRWRFTPATRGGVPVTQEVAVPVRFELSEGPES